MKGIRTLVRGTLVIMVTSSIVATGEPVWTWEDCLDQAATRNPQLAGAAARLRAADSGVRIARSALRPQLGVEAGADRRGVRDEEVPTETELRTTMAVNQVVYAGGRLVANADISVAERAVTEAAAWSTAVDVTFALRSAFIDLLHAQEELLLLKEVEQRRHDNLDLVELLYQGGKENKGAVALSEASLFEAETDIQVTERRMVFARHLLQRTAGLLELSETLQVHGVLKVLPPPATVNWQGILTRTPEFARAQAQRQSAAASLQRARGSRRPDLTVSAIGGRVGDHESFDRDQWRVGAALSYPFWSGGRERHEIYQARAVLEEIEFVQDDVQQQVLLTLEDTLKDYRNAIDLVAVRRRFLDASELRAEIARQQYTSGLLSFEDWSRIENDLIDNRRLVLSAMQTAMRAEARWLRAAGTTAFDPTADRKQP